MPTDQPKRRRRKPEAAETEILDAAEGFLKERPFREMTVDDVMARTGLSRPSFYEYFRDRHHLIMKLAERLGDWTYAISEPWLAGGAGSDDELRSGVERLVALYTERGHLLHALADAARQDKQVEIAYRRFIDRFIEGTAARIRMGLDNGTIKDLNPEETAAALIMMNERYLLERLDKDPRVNPEVLVETIFRVWWRVLHGG
jgi:TetR/AcrR family transcriptional regulator, ethionamide resistance regulator